MSEDSGPVSRNLGRMGIIIPVFNEERTVRGFHAALVPILDQLGCAADIVFVDDGSKDATRRVIRELRSIDERIRLIGLSRNFGKEAALAAGIDRVDADVAIPMDVDLQDPPHLIVDFVEKWKQGFDVVYGVRVDRESDTSFKRLTAGVFYRVFNFLATDTIPADTGDYRLLDRRVIEALRRLPERNRFMKGLFAWVGFTSVGVPYVRAPRSAGEPKIRIRHLWRLALDGITGFSSLPLRIWTYVGLVVAMLAFVYGTALIVRTLVYGIMTPGYASTIVIILFLGGVQLISLGVIGEYLGRLFIEVKRRPLYLIDEEF
ncbi:MAG: glycosyltransferase family 2 protein [bacterium]|nr:glycosyltransferase family 2 protein [bacterium]